MLILLYSVRGKKVPEKTVSGKMVPWKKNLRKEGPRGKYSRNDPRKNVLKKLGGGRKFERPNVERLIFRNLKITGAGQNFEQ